MGFGGLLAQGRPRKKSGSERRTRFGLGVTGQRLFLLGCRGKSPDGPGGFGRANEGVCGADEDRAGSRQRARSQRARAGGSHRHGAATEPGAHVAAERQRGGETRSSIRLVDQNSGATTVLSLSDVIASSGALPFRDVMIDPGEFVPEHTSRVGSAADARESTQGRVHGEANRNAHKDLLKELEPLNTPPLDSIQVGGVMARLSCAVGLAFMNDRSVPSELFRSFTAAQSTIVKHLIQNAERRFLA